MNDTATRDLLKVQEELKQVRIFKEQLEIDLKRAKEQLRESDERYKKLRQAIVSKEFKYSELEIARRVTTTITKEDITEVLCDAFKTIEQLESTNKNLVKEIQNLNKINKKVTSENAALQDKMNFTQNLQLNAENPATTFTQRDRDMLIKVLEMSIETNSVLRQTKGSTPRLANDSLVIPKLPERRGWIGRIIEKQKEKGPPRSTDVQRAYTTVRLTKFLATRPDLNPDLLGDGILPQAIKAVNGNTFKEVKGPSGDQGGDTNIGTKVYCRAMSTYPLKADKKGRQGDPVCDYYYAATLGDRVIVALADGCNWGQKARLAAQRAAETFGEFLLNNMHRVSSVIEVNKLLLAATDAANKSITENTAIKEAGTCTLLGGVLLPLIPEKYQPKKWIFICVNVGDCKAYVCSTKTQSIKDVTSNNRKFSGSAADPGGRLGPTDGKGDPDLRNLSISQAFCDDGDIIIVASDGVHDNLDPEHLGLLPTDFGWQCTSWAEMSAEDRTLLKYVKSTSILQDIIFSNTSSNPETSVEGRNNTNTNTETGEPTSNSPHCKTIVNAVLDYCFQLTSSSRAFLEENTNKKLPKDYVQYPGKMDHTTCIAFHVTDSPNFLSSPTPTLTSSSSPSLSVSMPPPSYSSSNASASVGVATGAAMTLPPPSSTSSFRDYFSK